MNPDIPTDHEGTEQLYLLSYSADILDGKPVPAGQGLNAEGDTGNHYAGACLVAYCGDQERGREKALDFLADQRQNGHCSHAGVDELGCDSHESYWQAPMSGLWLKGLRRKDEKLLPEVRTWWRRQQAFNIACRVQGQKAPGLLSKLLGGTPKPPPVVRMGARMPGGHEADQRVMVATGTALLAGESPRLPKLPNLQGAHDWRGIYFLTLIEKEFPGELQRAMAGLSHADLPGTKRPVNVARWGNLHLVWQEPPLYELKPCWFAFWDGHEARYGGDPAWDKYHRPTVDELTKDFPLPEVPSGATLLRFPLAPGADAAGRSVVVRR